jgi:hypothetical protein
MSSVIFCHGYKSCWIMDITYIQHLLWIFILIGIEVVIMLTEIFCLQECNVLYSKSVVTFWWKLLCPASGLKSSKKPACCLTFMGQQYCSSEDGTFHNPVPVFKNTKSGNVLRCVGTSHKTVSRLSANPRETQKLQSLVGHARLTA